MGKTCFVPLCKSGYRSCIEKVSLFKVPEDKLHLWQNQIARKDRHLSAGDVICEKHFEQHFIIREVKTVLWTYPLKYPRLSDDAVPTVFPGCPKEVKKRRIIIQPQRTPEVQVNDNNIKSSVVKKPQKLEDNLCENDDLTEVEFNDQRFFNDLFNQLVSPELPSKSWGIHFLVNPNGDNQICILEMVTTNRGEPVISKQMVLQENLPSKYYIFGHLIDNNTELDSKIIISLQDLQNVLLIFNNLFICYGGLDFDKAPNGFNNLSYRRDHILNVWRHQSCTFITDNANQCVFCTKNKRAATKFRYVTKQSKPSKEALIRKRLKNVSKRERRLKIKSANLYKELQLARTIIINLSKEDV